MHGTWADLILRIVRTVRQAQKYLIFSVLCKFMSAVHFRSKRSESASRSGLRRASVGSRAYCNGLRGVVAAVRGGGWRRSGRTERSNSGD